MFEFDFQPSLDKRRVREMAGLSFIECTDNVAMLGPLGVGKTHLAVALGVKAVEAGYSVLFHTLDAGNCHPEPSFAPLHSTQH